MTSLGYKLNNPFNLRANHIPWQGLVVPSSNKDFCEFTTALFGLRAGFINLKSQLKQYINTIEAIITKYAPSIENDTDAYIKAVEKEIGINRYYTLQDYNLKALGIAIIRHEQGSIIYDDTTINQALTLAGLPVSS